MEVVGFFYPTKSVWFLMVTMNEYTFLPLGWIVRYPDDALTYDLAGSWEVTQLLTVESGTYH